MELRAQAALGNGGTIFKAQENGAKIIHVDLRFTRTSATADRYARIRPGTDAALLNTMINYVA